MDVEPLAGENETLADQISPWEEIWSATDEVAPGIVPSQSPQPGTPKLAETVRLGARGHRGCHPSPDERGTASGCRAVLV